MKQIIIKITQWLTLLLSWLTISPLFVYLASRWKLISKKVRILLLLISPLMLIVYFIIFLLALQGYFDYQRKYQFRDKERIERITGIEFPDFKVISYKAGERDIRGEYTDNMEIEFKDTLSSAFYHTLDSMIATNKTDWNKSDNYHFSKIWGNGLPAPESEDNEEDIFFDISFKKNSNRAKIRYGMW